MNRICLADPRARHRLDGELVEAAVVQVLRSGRLIGGPVVADAETAAARLFRRRGAVGVNSGTDALMLALIATGVRPGDEVLVPALTFFATAGAVVAIGAIPVPVDVDERGLIDMRDAASAVGPHTRAIIPVHLFGNAVTDVLADMPSVDDLAQAAGADPPVGHAKLGAVSCYPTKIWGASGDAGFVVSDDIERLAAIRALGNHGLVDVHLHHAIDEDAVGRNSRLDAVQAAILLGRLHGMAADINRRQTIARRYDNALADFRPLRRDSGNPVPQYVLDVPRRDATRKRLDEAGIDSAPLYPLSLTRQPALAHVIRPRPTPIADDKAAHFLSIPCHGGLTDEDVDRVIAAMIT